MPRTITISLPVADLQASKAFYTALGFVQQPQCTGEGAALMAWSETISVILLSHALWRRLTTRPIPPSTTTEVALNISCESRAMVDAMTEAAAAHGGIADVNPVEDEAFMYGRDFTDLDGHVWGAKWMDMSAMPAGA